MRSPFYNLGLRTPFADSSLAFEITSATFNGTDTVALIAPGCDTVYYRVRQTTDPVANAATIVAGGGEEAGTWTTGSQTWEPSPAAGTYAVDMVGEDNAGDPGVYTDVVTYTWLLPGPANAFLSLLGSKLIADWDFTDVSTMWQETSKTTQVASASDPIGYIEDKSGNGNDMDADLTGSAYSNGPTYTADGALWDATAMLRAAQAMTGFTSTMEVYILVRTGTEDDFMMLGEEGDASAYLGLADSGAGGSPQGDFGTPTYMLDGSDVASTTRGTLYTNWDNVAATADRVLGARAVDMSGKTGDGALLLAAYDLQGLFQFTTTIARVIITTALTTQERSDTNDIFTGLKN